MAIQRTIDRLGVPENLANGSTYEMLLISVSGGYPVGEVSFTLEDTPRKITGIQKVAQMFMKVLFTQKGSDILNFTLGTEFPNLCLGANRTSNDASFLSDVASAIKDAESQVRNLLSSQNGDLDSQLDKVVIQNLEVDGESLTMFVQIITMAGETASVAIPFPEMDMKLANS